MKSIEQQIRAMAAQWPEFKLTEHDHGDQSASWEGVLAPDKRKHLVRVRYRVPMVLENISLRDAQPRVQVITPLLERHPDYEEGPIPHVYKSEATPDLPYLCLFSVELRQWDINDLIAETTIFWAAEWLYFYEGWLVTKKWKGGGRHLYPGADGEKRIETV
jgi:hypothetical protein